MAGRAEETSGHRRMRPADRRFGMHVPGIWWAGTFVAIVALLLVDVFVTRRQKRAPSTSEAARWVVFYVSAAIAFGICLAVGFGGEYGGQFFAEIGRAHV